MASTFSFRLQAVDPGCAARRSTFWTPHGAVELPAFMPVGTLGTVKGLEADQLRVTGAQMILANTYHLALRPGEEVVAALGGLHGFMGWDGPILTDSGGFQLFSLAQMTRIDEQQATFRSHIDGRLFELSPERAVAIQEALGSDVAMVLDHVVPLPNHHEVSPRRRRSHHPLGGTLPESRPAIRPGPVCHRPRRARSRTPRALRAAVGRDGFSWLRHRRA